LEEEALSDPELPRDGRARIVVAYDGSPASRVALRCAARHAGPNGVVVAVHSYDVPLGRMHAPGRAAEYQELLETERARGQALLDELPDLGEVAVEKELLSGPTARVVANAAAERDAVEIVLGTRGLGRARSLLGSVAHELIHLAACPVTVIPERAVERLAGDAGRAPDARRQTPVNGS
jgi:nucleotide-binding universal stress UspA family protein